MPLGSEAPLQATSIVGSFDHALGVCEVLASVVGGDGGAMSNTKPKVLLRCASCLSVGHCAAAALQAAGKSKM
jgi:hypothetical protein